MKKLVTVFALCAAFSAYAQVESANVVGYNTVTIDKMWSIVAVNFQSTASTDISLQAAIPYSVGMTTNSAAATADNIQIQNGVGGYDIYFMGNGFVGKTSFPATSQKWVKSGETFPTTNVVTSGSAFWYLRRGVSNFNITVAGQVLSTATADAPISLTWKHIANPYATDLPLNDGLPYVAGMTTNSAAATADNIQIQNGVGGYDIYFMGNGFVGKTSFPATIQKWVKSGETAPTTAALPAGKGAWYLRRGGSTFNITITRPFSL